MKMCWSEKDNGNCHACQAIFDACTHRTTFINEHGENECTFCQKIAPKDIRKKDTCKYCGWEFDSLRRCSQMCMAR